MGQERADALAGVNMRRVTALPLSFVAHAVALATAVMLSVMPADLPAARAESRPPLQFEVPRVTVVAVAPPARSTAARPSHRLPAEPAPPVTTAPPPLAAMPVTPVPVDLPIVGPGSSERPGIEEHAGTCVGCVVGKVDSFGREGNSGNGEGSNAAEPYRVGGSIREPRKLKHVVPVYPEMARVARVGGNVTIECTVTPEGSVADVRVVSGHPLLTEAAARAVEQWQFTPTLLNGVPVPVILTVTVRFQLR
jgi:periplasmic protein TonB